ncbi:hypothetical protein [Glaesserella parasuis]|nr:hypothetical protein [Glaesserella parasuis]MDE3992782.1 hypothetical protein [Glaesserella parasuis]
MKLTKITLALAGILGIAVVGGSVVHRATSRTTLSAIGSTR